MEKLLIEGGRSLNGEINISGMKNSALPIIFSCLLIKDECIIHNVPRVSDVIITLEILRGLGAKAEFFKTNSVRIDSTNATNDIKNQELVSKMRASSYLMGTLLARFGEVSINMPGGCNFGVRPIEQHLMGFEMLGGICTEKNGKIKINAPKGLKSKKITLDKISVGATINMVLASIYLDGLTIVQNCAIEPHVDDLIRFLNRCGAKIIRQGRTIYVYGVNMLHGTEYNVYPDMIEALTYMCFTGICGGKVTLHSVVPHHLNCTTNVLRKMGLMIHEYGDTIDIVCSKTLRGANVVTAPYPFFPTDIHPQFSALLCYTSDGGSVREEIFPTRFAYVKELEKMGARIKLLDNIAVVSKSSLKGTEVDATDLRAGAALIAAALGICDTCKISNVNYIIRGYENLISKISDLGGKIKLINN